VTNEEATTLMRRLSCLVIREEALRAVR